MYCPKCGYQNNDNAEKCFQCSQALPREGFYEKGTPIKIKTYRTQAILYILCCIPTGIAALYYSLKADSAAIKGNISEAKIAAEKAKMWCIISFILGIIFLIYTIVLSIKLFTMVESFLQ